MVQLPSLLQLVTECKKDFASELSGAFMERHFWQLHESLNELPFFRFLLRNGCAPGATTFVSPQPSTLDENHCSSNDNMTAHIYRTGIRYILGMEAVPGMTHAVTASGGRCPSCGDDILPNGAATESWVVQNHLISCGSGGWTQRISRALVRGLAWSYNEVGIRGTCETHGLSETSQHRPGDFTSAEVDNPPESLAAGFTKRVHDMVVIYLNNGNAQAAADSRPDQLVRAAEAEKRNSMAREIERGERTGLPEGYSFHPASMNTRGRMGPELQKTLEFLAHHAATHSSTLSYLGETGQDIKAFLLRRFRTHMSNALHCSIMEALSHRMDDVKRTLEGLAGPQNGGELGAVDVRLYMRPGRRR
jgi:hypothetical protein